MKKVFRTRIDWWLAAILIFVAVAPIVSACINGVFDLWTVVISLFILSLFRTVYVVNDSKLRVWVGVIPYGKKEIGQIKSVHRTSSLISSPALSIDRLAITFVNGDRLIISPKDREEFVASLLAVNPQIVTDETVDEQALSAKTTDETEVSETSSTRRWANIVWAIDALIILAQALYVYSIYDTLPERIATHFDLDGVPNGWMGRFWGIWGTVLISGGITLLLWALPRIPGLTISGTENASEADKQKAKEKMSLILACFAILHLAIFFFVDLYIISKN